MNMDFITLQILRNEWATRNRKLWLANGICITCGAHPVKEGISRYAKPYTHCELCIARSKKWREAHVQ